MSVFSGKNELTLIVTDSHRNEPEIAEGFRVKVKGMPGDSLRRAQRLYG
jgi:hypothetical protein